MIRISLVDRIEPKIISRISDSIVVLVGYRLPLLGGFLTVSES
jgi:hypothetical protein